MRKVLFRKLDREASIYTDYIFPGSFHQWGFSVIETRDAVANYSVAIIELPDGTVKLIDPEDIKFIS